MSKYVEDFQAHQLDINCYKIYTKFCRDVVFYVQFLYYLRIYGVYV